MDRVTILALHWVDHLFFFFLTVKLDCRMLCLRTEPLITFSFMFVVFCVIGEVLRVKTLKDLPE